MEWTSEVEVRKRHNWLEATQPPSLGEQGVEGGVMLQQNPQEREDVGFGLTQVISKENSFKQQRCSFIGNKPMYRNPTDTHIQGSK